jgi:hypothetical protein
LGTFGVVVSVTLRTFDEVPVILTNFNVTTSMGDPRFWDAVVDFHAAIPSFNDATGGGYYWLAPNVQISENTSISAVTVMLVFTNQTDTKQIDKLYTPLISKLNCTAGVTTQYTSVSLPSVGYLFTKLFLSGISDDTGGISILGPRLFSRDLLVSSDGPGKLVSAMRSLRSGPGQAILGLLVAGGAVAKNAGQIDSALNPAWREAITHIVIPRGWNQTATLEEQEAVRKNLTEVEVPILRAVEGDDKMGAY